MIIAFLLHTDSGYERFCRNALLSDIGINLHPRWNKHKGLQVQRGVGCIKAGTCVSFIPLWIQCLVYSRCSMKMKVAKEQMYIVRGVWQKSSVGMWRPWSCLFHLTSLHRVKPKPHQMTSVFPIASKNTVSGHITHLARNLSEASKWSNMSF